MLTLTRSTPGFYDWVDEARRDIRVRGEEPAALLVEPGGAEIAGPAERFVALPPPRAEPDRRGRVRRDPGRFVGVEAAVVPPAVKPCEVTRVHVVFRPNAPSTPIGTTRAVRCGYGSSRPVAGAPTGES